MPRPKNQRTRPIQWTGRLSPEAREAQEAYVQHLKRTGQLPYEDDDVWYAKALPDAEVKGEV